MLNKATYFYLIAFVLFFSCKKTDSSTPTEPGSSVLSISYYNDLIVFNFPKEYTVGQFANGDYWVHNNGANVVISSITPASTTANGRVINGTMVNPEDSNKQGYDSSPRDMIYEASLNVDPGITGQNLTLSPGSSVIKSISMESDAGRPIISDAAVLTILAENPPAGAFRPPYTGSDKSIIATKSDLNYEVLGTHAKLGGEPDITEVAGYYKRVWIEHCTEWVQRDIHPQNNMPAYGRDICSRSATGLILLQLDYTQAQKEELLIGLVQYGIDIYGVAKNGGVWYNNGGHNTGRKMPLLMTAKVLNNSDMLAYADKEQHFIFQDDQQHFYVSQAEVDMTHSAEWAPDDRADPIPYEVSDIGMAEWGIRHTDMPHGDNMNWEATHRHVNGPAETKQILAAHLMDVKNEWNWLPVFDYIDRYYAIEQPDAYEDYFVALWETYR